MSQADVLILFTRLEDLETPPSDAQLQEIPDAAKQEIFQYKKSGDRVRLWAGKMLLKILLGKLGKEALLENYAVDEMGRPFIPGGPDFNITHSGNIVAVALSSTCRVGLDVEKHRPINYADFTKQFSPPEMQVILDAEDPSFQFFEYWTQKESVMKADGRGMRIPLHDIRLLGDFATVEGRPEQWKLYPFGTYPGYSMHLCSPAAKIGIHIEECRNIVER